jgi:DNA polymerase-3 subunit epsilon
MSAWWEGRMVGFDLETTSADPEEARIVTSAVAFVGGGEPTETFTQLVNPGVEIPAEATAMHGITTERALEEGIESGEAVATLLGQLLAAVESGWPLDIFNARYDLTVLDREARRHELPPISENPKLRVIDPRVIDGHIERYRPGKRTLSATIAYYASGVGSVVAGKGWGAGEDAHSADHDALAVARLAWVMGKYGRVVRRVWNDGDAAELERLQAEWDEARVDLDKLYALQIEWADFQARGLEDYFREQGNAKLVDRVWPVILPGQRREGTEGQAPDVHTSAASSPPHREPEPRRVETPPDDIEAAKLALFEMAPRPEA